ncbi:MAG: protein phosphatase 2C domain-containing protein [Propionibacteriaceae bacterium]|jgi:protein phosphatase|nr:protein phosphatase 2C domain-containing protein [Propionibacteriaceae bacterium]
MTLILDYVAHSEIGLVRKNNQDSAYASPRLLLVADGMGGAAAGDLASAVVIRTFRQVDGKAAGERMLQLLAEAVEEANDQIAELVQDDPELDGMGSTVCGAMFDGQQLGLVNVGDSRAYLYRDGVLKRITHDHSWVQALVDEGRLTEADSLVHPHRSLILRVINGQGQHQPDLSLVPLQAGDRLLFCSDGLAGLVVDADIAARMDGPLPAVKEALIELAHDAGGSDNISIILADAQPAPEPEPAPAPAGETPEGESAAAPGAEPAPAETPAAAPTPPSPPGERVILGAAALIDLDEPLSEITTQLPAIIAEQTAAPIAEEEIRYAPTGKRKVRSLVKVLFAVILPIIAVVTGVVIWYEYTQQQYYVGQDSGTVAIYRGVPDPVLGIPLSTMIEKDTTLVSDLPQYYQDQVTRTIRSGSLSDARLTVVELQVKARYCIQQRQQPAYPTPSASPDDPKDC